MVLTSPIELLAVIDAFINTYYEGMMWLAYGFSAKIVHITRKAVDY